MSGSHTNSSHPESAATLQRLTARVADLEKRLAHAAELCQQAYIEGWGDCDSRDIEDERAGWEASDARHNLYEDPEAPCPGGGQ